MVNFPPEKWYNVVPDLPAPLPPPMDPPDAESSSIELLNQIMPREVLRHQFTVERWISIPDEIRDAYAQVGRPTPLLRAKRFEEAIGTKARIYFKYEGATPTGSHKINAAIPQAYFALKEGVTGLSTETGAGQWGAAVALASSIFGISSTVFMVRTSYEQKPLRRLLMEMYGAKVYPSPSEKTEPGRAALGRDKNARGSLGLAMSEAIEYALKNGLKYAVGSVLDVVLMYQSVIGLEAKAQLEAHGEVPDVLIGCVGGGSNFGGFVYPFIGSGIGKRYIAVGPTEIPKFSSGSYRYDYPDSAGILPLVKMLTLGREYAPPPIYAGGLRYHGVAPSLSLLVREGVVEAMEVSEEEAVRAGLLFARSQGIVPAAESAHAVAAVIRAARESAPGTVIAFNMSGHGLLELDVYRRSSA